jgi:hypothetical protein
MMYHFGTESPKLNVSIPDGQVTSIKIDLNIAQKFY